MFTCTCMHFLESLDLQSTCYSVLLKETLMMQPHFIVYTKQPSKLSLRFYHNAVVDTSIVFHTAKNITWPTMYDWKPGRCVMSTCCMTAFWLKEITCIM